MGYTGDRLAGSLADSDASWCSMWNVDIGPLSISSNGMQVKPQCLLGARVGNFHTSAGVSDVREGQGLKLSATAEAAQNFAATGESVREFFKNVKASDGLADDLINPVVERVDDIVVLVLERIGVDIGGPCHVDGFAKLKFGVGAGAAIALGWEDSEGYRMVGAGGGAACALHLAFAVFAGLRDPGDHRHVKLIIDASNVTVVARIRISEESLGASEGASRMAATESESECRNPTERETDEARDPLITG